MGVYLDLDDCAAGNPVAEQQLRELRAELELKKKEIERQTIKLADKSASVEGLLQKWKDAEKENSELRAELRAAEFENFQLRGALEKIQAEETGLVEYTPQGELTEWEHVSLIYSIYADSVLSTLPDRTAKLRELVEAVIKWEECFSRELEIARFTGEPFDDDYFGTKPGTLGYLASKTRSYKEVE